MLYEVITVFGAMLFPLGYALYYSFFNYKLGGVEKFIGLENYINVLQSGEFWNAVKFSLDFTLIS